MIEPVLTAPIAGERILIRNAIEQDLGPWYDLQSDIAVMRYAGGVTGATRPAWTEKMKNPLNRNRFLMVECKPTHDFVGWASLTPYLSPPQSGHNGHDPKECLELRVFLVAQSIGKWIGREAGRLLIDWGFNSIGAICIVALVSPDNNRSLKLIDALGFCDDGIDEPMHRFQILSSVR